MAAVCTGARILVHWERQIGGRQAGTQHLDFCPSMFTSCGIGSVKLASVFLYVVVFGDVRYASVFTGLGDAMVGSLGRRFVKPALQWPIILLVDNWPK